MTWPQLWRIFGVILLTGGTVVASEELVPAFPGAEGFGAASVGGRGGRVIKVTNLNPTGPGSLQAAHPPRMNQQRPDQPFRTNLVANYYKDGPNASMKERAAKGVPLIRWKRESEKAHNFNPADAANAAKIVPAGASKDDRHKGYTFIEFYITDLADKLVSDAR